MSEKGMLKVEGIECNNPDCDYENTDLLPHEYQHWVDKPCPKCGEILLTQNDYNMYKFLNAMTSIANKITPEEEVLSISTTKVYTPQSKSVE